MGNCVAAFWLQPSLSHRTVNKVALYPLACWTEVRSQVLSRVTRLYRPVGCDTLFAHRMRAHFEAGIACAIGPAQQSIFISASVGFAFYPEHGMTAGDLFRTADKSMYAHKRGASVA